MGSPKHDGMAIRLRHRRILRVRNLAGAARADIRRGAGPDAVLLRDQHVHLRDGPPDLSRAGHLPQALVLTAIVIAFAMTALVLTLALKGRFVNGSDACDADDDAAMKELPR